MLTNNIKEQARDKLYLHDLIEDGVLVLLFLVPFHSFLLFPGISIVKATGIALVPLWILWMLTRMNNPQGAWVMSWLNFRLVISMVLFIISIIISALYEELSPLYTTSLTTIILNFGMTLVIFTVISSSEHSTVRAYKWLALGGIPAALLVITEYIAPQKTAALLGQRLFVTEFGIRATGAFRDPNYGALILVVLTCLSFNLALTCRKRWQRTLLFLGVALEVIAVLLTFSRGAYVLLGLMGLMILWRERHRLRVWKTALVSIILGFVLLAVLGKGILDLLTSRAGTLVESVKLLLGNNPEQLRQFDLSLWYRFQFLPASLKMMFSKSH